EGGGVGAGAGRGWRPGRGRRPRDRQRGRRVDSDQPRSPDLLRPRPLRRSHPHDRGGRRPLLGGDAPASGVMATSRVPLRLWLGYWRVLQRYHRYTVNGLEHLDGSRAALIVGYHGSPFAYDMCMLTVALYDLLGYLPHGIVHRGMKQLPVLRWLVDGLGFLTGDDDDLGRAVARGEHIVVTPGRAREGCRSFRSRYRAA